jgi:hypothetical protein
MTLRLKVVQIYNEQKEVLLEEFLPDAQSFQEKLDSVKEKMHVGSTSANATSSRAHTIYGLEFSGKKSPETSVESVLKIVDLGNRFATRQQRTYMTWCLTTQLDLSPSVLGPANSNDTKAFRSKPAFLRSGMS